MPFSVQGEEALSEKIAVRLTPAEKAKLREDADLAGLSVSELVRRRYFGRRIVHHADLKTAAILSDIWSLVRRLGDRQEN